jgi:hypothetical protein
VSAAAPLRATARTFGYLALAGTALFTVVGVSLVVSSGTPPYVDPEPSWAPGEIMDFPNTRDRILWGVGAGLDASAVTCEHPGVDGAEAFDAGPPAGQEDWATVVDEDGVELTYLASTASTFGGVGEARCDGPGLEAVRVSPAPDPGGKRTLGTGFLGGAAVALLAAVVALRTTRRRHP